VLWIEVPLETRISDLTADASGYYATGSHWGVTSWGRQRLVSQGRGDGFVGRFDSNGEVSWLRTIGGAEWDRGQSVTLSADGSLIVLGHFEGKVDFGVATFQGPAKNNCFVSKLSREDGRVHWGRSLGGSDGEISCMEVASDAAGDLFVTGNFRGGVTLGAERFQSVGGYDIFLLKLSGRDGTPLWARRLGGAGEDFVRDVTVTPLGAVLLTGGFSGRIEPQQGAIDLGIGLLTSQGGADAFLAAFSANDGHLQWARAFGGPLSDDAWSMVVAQDGSIYLAGWRQLREATFWTKEVEGGFLAAFSPRGLQRWWRQWPTMTPGQVLTLTPKGQLVLGSSFQGELELGAGVSLRSVSGRDLVVAGFSTTGQALWAEPFGGPEDDSISAVAATAHGVAVGCIIPPEIGW
jgi:outer membrane protein assembly factor BamB